MSESSTEYADPGWPHEPSEAARSTGLWAPIDAPNTYAEM